MGITLEEAQSMLKEMREDRIESDDDALAMFSVQALRTALSTLKRATREKNRGVMKKDVSEDGDGGRIIKEEREVVIDVDAAKALMNAGLEVQKILDKRRGRGTGDGKVKLTAEGAPGDLFDLAGPWQFKQRD